MGGIPHWNRRLELLVGDDCYGLGIRKDVSDLAPAVQNIHRHKDDAELYTGQENVDQIHAVREIDAEAVAAPKPAARQARGETIAACVDLAEGERGAFELYGDLRAPSA